MISILPKKTLYMTDIICTETILYRQVATRQPFFIQCLKAVNHLANSSGLQ